MSISSFALTSVLLFTATTAAAPRCYTRFPDRHCSGSNELVDGVVTTIAGCQALCDADPTCKSFETTALPGGPDTGHCYASNSCDSNTHPKAVDRPAKDLYILTDCAGCPAEAQTLCQSAGATECVILESDFFGATTSILMSRDAEGAVKTHAYYSWVYTTSYASDCECVGECEGLFGKWHCTSGGGDLMGGIGDPDPTTNYKYIDIKKDLGSWRSGTRWKTTPPQGYVALNTWVNECTPDTKPAVEETPDYEDLGSGVCSGIDGRTPYCQVKNIAHSECKKLCDDNETCVGYNPASHKAVWCFLFGNVNNLKAAIPAVGNNCDHDGSSEIITGHDGLGGGTCYRKLKSGESAVTEDRTWNFDDDMQGFEQDPIRYEDLGPGVCSGKDSGNPATDRAPYCQVANLSFEECKKLCDDNGDACTGYNPESHGVCFIFGDPNILKTTISTNCHRVDNSWIITGSDGLNGGNCYRKLKSEHAGCPHVRSYYGHPNGHFKVGQGSGNSHFVYTYIGGGDQATCRWRDTKHAFTVTASTELSYLYAGAAGQVRVKSCGNGDTVASRDDKYYSTENLKTATIPADDLQNWVGKRVYLEFADTGTGAYEWLALDNIEVKNAFGFGPCDYDPFAPTSSPTAEPTTASPTSAPTANPTSSPTSNPTSSPTAEPTTANPTSSPTAEPTTANPTSSPTSSPTFPSDTVSMHWGAGIDDPSKRAVSLNVGTKFAVLWQGNVGLSVYELVDKTHFDNCDFTNAKPLAFSTSFSRNSWSHSDARSYTTTVTKGTKYLVAGGNRDAWCKNGQKLALTGLADPTSAPTPRPTPNPTSTPTAEPTSGPTSTPGLGAGSPEKASPSPWDKLDKAIGGAGGSLALASVGLIALIASLCVCYKSRKMNNRAARLQGDYEDAVRTSFATATAGGTLSNLNALKSGTLDANGGRTPKSPDFVAKTTSGEQGERQSRGSKLKGRLMNIKRKVVGRIALSETQVNLTTEEEGEFHDSDFDEENPANGTSGQWVDEDPEAAYEK